MITRTVFIVGIFVCGIYNLKTNCASSQDYPTNEIESEEPQEEEETGASEMFKPTHEWQRIKEGKLVIFAT
jgi:hypothetical protein